jgi:hypothetical protein
MATQLEKLRALKASHDPTLAVLSHIQTLKGEKGDKGDPGKDGQDGKHFIGSQGIPGIPGRNGRDGKDGAPGHDVVGKPGRDGKDGKDGISPSIDAIIKELKKMPISFKDIKDAPDLTDLPQLIKFLKAGGFRGGGDTITAGANITVTRANGLTTVAATSGGGFTTLLPTQTPNGVLNVFTFAAATAKPSFIIVDNAWQQATTKSGTVNWTWNAGAKQATFTVPPSDDVIGVV